MMLTAGQAAKSFALQDNDGKPISFSDFKGQKVVIYFYAKDETPGCTKQACAFQDSYAGFTVQRIVIGRRQPPQRQLSSKFGREYSNLK